MEDSEFFIKVGQNITRIRKQKGFTIQKLADEIDMEKSNLIPIEKGRINTTLSTLLKISKALGIEPKKLFEF